MKKQRLGHVLLLSTAQSTPLRCARFTPGTAPCPAWPHAPKPFELGRAKESWHFWSKDNNFLGKRWVSVYAENGFGKFSAGKHWIFRQCAYRCHGLCLCFVLSPPLFFNFYFLVKNEVFQSCTVSGSPSSFVPWLPGHTCCRCSLSHVAGSSAEGCPSQHEIHPCLPRLWCPGRQQRLASLWLTYWHTQGTRGGRSRRSPSAAEHGARVLWKLAPCLWCSAAGSVLSPPQGPSAGRGCYFCFGFFFIPSIMVFMAEWQQQETKEGLRVEPRQHSLCCWAAKWRSSFCHSIKMLCSFIQMLFHLFVSVLISTGHRGCCMGC